MKIKLNVTEKAIIKRHAPAARGRALLELEIVCALIREADNRGYELLPEEADLGLVHGDNVFKESVFNLDDATIVVLEDNKEIGWIKLVFGNDEWDLISDYSTGLESFLAPVNELAKFWGRLAMDDLSKVKAGDRVVLLYRSEAQATVAVERTTVHYIIVNGDRYRRRDGSRVGDRFGRSNHHRLSSVEGSTHNTDLYAQIQRCTAN